MPTYAHTRTQGPPHAWKDHQEIGTVQGGSTGRPCYSMPSSTTSRRARRTEAEVKSSLHTPVRRCAASGTHCPLEGQGPGQGPSFPLIAPPASGRGAATPRRGPDWGAAAAGTLPSHLLHIQRPGEAAALRWEKKTTFPKQASPRIARAEIAEIGGNDHGRHRKVKPRASR